VANETVTLVATVTASDSTAAPSGTITFTNRGEPIDGCGAVSVAPTDQSVTVVCRTSFAAATAMLSATFTPAAGSTVTGSRSATDSVYVDRDSSVISLDASNTVNVGVSTTYTATVAPPPSRPGPIEPTGTIEFADGGQPITSCASQRLLNAGATCTVTYKSPGAHSITATYGGDANFTGSTSSGQAVRVVPVPVEVLGTITSTMQWTFAYTPTYTKVLALVVNGVPVGATVLIKCNGRGCPYARHATYVFAKSRCGKRGKRMCSGDPRIDLRSGFRRHRLRPGAKITVVISRHGWIGKYYAFVIRARRAPQIQISCLAPGRARPGMGC
jgi:Bacterial Ig-like domain (group 3)